ncbi:E3 ubiquitin-protein ligase UPL2-like isoform X1 [Cynara cardunculus var. scolymus]|uniref:E3 ubiquitin-protein ligase UPL2-like isoform X1 n=1 Tax=Cynara cardunculus var. scolymus TaxID=59895 RepID=UPI000D62EB39|nr:E3 ubiquitin-protein ligase UPL2-like isoform X1 [Cynara cardunculus var. scolymus]
MAGTLRSSLPSRLRQLLSGEGPIGPNVKLESETPPKVKAFIDKVILCPLQDIAIPLSGFRWEYDKGNFHHWRPLFMHFDTYFKTYLSARKDLLLADNIIEEDGPFPKQSVLQILRVMQIILENCHNKGSFSGLEHFKLLLASTDPEVLIATLETLSTLVKINPSKLHASGKLVGCGPINNCLLSLAQGWGSKEEGLGLYSCVILNERTQDDGLSLFPSDVPTDSGNSQNRLGSSLYFEFHGPCTQTAGEVGNLTSLPSTTVIHIPDLHMWKEDDLSILKLLVEQYNVPPEHRFLLLTRVRYAHAFRSPRICRLYSKICLLAFIVLVQSNDSHEELVSFFANEPEYTNELIRLVKSEETISRTIRTLAMHALGSQLAAYSSSHERARILSGLSISFAVGNRVILLNVLQRAISSLNNSSDPPSIAFLEALLQFYLLQVISTSSPGSVIRGSGMVPTFLPLLEDTDPTHMHLVCLAVKTLQKLMDYSNSAVTLFRDLGGVELLTSRLQIEVVRVIDSTTGDDSSMSIGECSDTSDDQLYSQKRLITVLLKALGSANYAPANSTRSQSAHDVSLPDTISMIFKKVDKFGGDIYSSAVTVMCEMIHKDPTCYAALDEAGLPDAFLSSVRAGVLPSSKSLTCVPNGLGAICLNATGLEAVRETSALRFLVDIFTDKKYVLPMNDGIVPLANAIEELMRHVSSLRSTGVDLIIEIINKISSTDDNKCTLQSGKANGSVMDMDTEEKENAGPCLVGATDSTLEGVSDEHFIQLNISHVMVLVHRTMENAETCRLFVEKAGIEALLKLLLRPSITQSSEGMSIALHSTMVFKSFTQHHSAPLARAFCSSLRDYLKTTLAAFSVLSGSFLLDPKFTPDTEVFPSLFLVEFLLFLAASKDNRWVTALLQEFGNGSKDVLEDIGRIHREILWQIALLEDAKFEIEDASAGTADESRLSESEEQRFNSFRQFLDPLMRRRMSGWSFESQFFDLINLYRDLTHASGFQQRHNTGGPSELRLGASHRSHPSGSSDMMRSLSLHITHLFQELGKAMLLPSRRRDDMVTVTPSSRSVASTFASITLDHMNFEGHVKPFGSVASWSTKCRYLGKVVDFIDGILLDKPDSCNPVLLNCLYGLGVLQSVLTTFEATSDLLFTVNRTPTSPMETDEGVSKLNDVEETVRTWINGPLANYGRLMDHLVTSSFILSPSTKHLLAQPLVNGDIPFPRDPEVFVKILQSMILKAVLPLWTHPHFTDCNDDFIATVISIIRHVFSGIEVKSVSNVGSRPSAPPPSETTISTIVEMGFSRSRAEEALRQVGSNSVELAMEWLFSHPEQVQEDDELARALAMSLGNSASDAKDTIANETDQHIEEENVQLPPVDELLSTCKKLLETKDSLAFSVRNLLLMICSQDDGRCRSKVITFILEQVKFCSSVAESGKNTMLSSLFHVLALLLNEDKDSREVASKGGLVKVAADLLSHWIAGTHEHEAFEVPKWVTAAFLAVDRLAQVDQKLNADISELLKKDDVGKQTVVIDEDKPNLGLSSKHVNIEEQKRLVEISCGYLRNQLSAETIYAVLQLCSTLTRTHSVAVSFLNAGGLPLLLSLPAGSLFVGFDNVAATIIRHILEDPQTLQQAMESEIRQSVLTAANRQSNGRLTPRSFLLNLTSVISRDPVIFMRAAQSVCQIEMVGERPYVVLLKDREKDKSKEKEKEKENEKEKTQTASGKSNTSNTNSLGPGSVNGKLSEANTKHAKVHRKPPQSFVNVVELLLASVVTFVPPAKDEAFTGESSSLTAMDIDVALNKGKGKAVASASEVNENSGQEYFTSMAKVVFILKLLTEILLMYGPSVHVLLRRDGEVSSCRSPGQKGLTSLCAGGVFHHILHRFLPYSRNSKKEKKTEVDWRHKLAGRASQFLVASCVRSTEARKRIFMEINSVFNDFVDSSKVHRPPGNDIQAFVDLLSDVLAARSPTGSSISGEASVTFLDAGLVGSLTRTLQVLDLDHAESLKIIPGLVKVLELVTKEHVHAAEANTGRGDNTTKAPDHTERRQTENIGDISESRETAYLPNAGSAPTERIESFSTVQTYRGSEAVTDDMEHDQDIDGSFAPPSEDDYMHETSENTRVLENGFDSVGIRFEIQPDIQESIDEDDDEEMSGDEGDEVDDEDEEDEDGDDDENNDLEEDEVHHLPHPDTDQDDHEIDEDDFDEDMIEEEDEDDDDDDGRVILGLGEGMNGINVLDHIEVFGRDHGFSNDTLQVMPVEVFGSRRQGRTTSIYNLLGRAGDTSAPSQHPLLMEPSRSISSRQADNVRDGYPERNAESTSSRLDSIFRSLRNGRHGQHGHRLSMWADDQQSGGSNASSIPSGLEDLLVSHLRPPTSGKASGHDTIVEVQTNNETGQLQTSAGLVPEATTEDNGNNNPIPISLNSSQDSESTPTVDESRRGSGAFGAHPQSVDMQSEHNSVLRDVEAVSQESSESGATLGESLRSLDVEIGSADGHDDGCERQGPADSRSRRANVSLGNTTSVSEREASLHSVTEVSENPSQETEQGDTAQDAEHDGGSGSAQIDPAFLDALPEELRAEVVSGRQGPVTQPSNTEPQNGGDIDPEFLAALPPDIRAEVLAQQQAQGAQRSQELEGQPVEMDTVSIIATFPSEIREEVLLTSSDAVLSNLTPALVAEANMLRERFARRYNRTLFGMFPRSRRGESSRRGEGIGSSLDRASGAATTRRSTGSKPIETDGAPLVDTEDLRAMIRLLRVVQPLYKPQLQRLLLNLCAHVDTRSAIIKILMDLLVLDTRRPSSDLDASEPSYRLYACQSNLMYSRAQSFDGVPPLVSRRVLETLTYLARNHKFVAKFLLQFRIRPAAIEESQSLDQARGKAVMIVHDDETEKQQYREGLLAITLLLSLLKQPLYLRSIAHLEQLLNLLDVIIDNAESKQGLVEHGESLTEETAQMSTLDADINAGAAGSGSGSGSGSDAKPSKVDDAPKPLSSGANRENESHNILLNLPQPELRLLCSLLACESLSDNAYALVADILKKLVAIAPSHCHLFITELAGSMKNLTTLAIDELHVFGEMEKALISTSGSDGAAILRVIQALSSLVASLNQEKEQTLLEKEQAATLSLVNDINVALEPLWMELSTCISKIESYTDTTPDVSASSIILTSRPSGALPPLPAGTQNILPYIESFFVMCEKLHFGQSGAAQDFGVAAVPSTDDVSTSDNQQKTLGACAKVDEKNVAFVKFSEKHRKLLNAFIRQNPGLLEKSFSVMLKVPRFIDFDNKRSYFRSKIKHQHDHHHSAVRISVRRAYILEDSYNQLRMRSTQDLKGRLTVHFQGEEGIDAGGLTREWYQLLSRVIFDKGALLFTTVGNESTFQPNPNSVYQTEHLSYFKFVGRVVGKALFDGQLLDVHFTRSFYKHILGAKVTYHDIEAIDPGFFRNLKWMLENDNSDNLDLTFSIDADEEKLILCERAEVTDYELIPGGRNIRVTEENKHEYVDLIAEHRLTTAIRPQINAFLEGFNELIPRDFISIFHDKELELLISGLPDIDLDDMRVNTEYSGYSAASPVIQWFWEVAQGFSKEDKARLLQFVTGTSKVPLEGFSALQGISGSQKFQIHKAYGSADRLPSAHTCFNQLDLPEYPSKQHLEERLLLAIHEANEGFGFG